MGGDFAPANVVAGALQALRESDNRFHVILVGPDDRIRQSLSTLDHQNLSYDILHAPQVIDMHDDAMAAVKQKRDSSIAVGILAQKEGRADAFVSAGHTGAVMSASTLILGRLEGVSRPTIGTFIPTAKGVCLLLDAGANVDCKPQNLLEFAIMGSSYSQKMLRLERPTVGLLSIGEETSKGNVLTWESHKLLSESRLNFIGNVEGGDILRGKADIVVCDGFVGNVVLKFAESVLDFLKWKFRDYASNNLARKLWIGMMYGTLKKILQDFDYQEYGGVPLLGVNGISIIGHGKSTSIAIKNMIFKAEEMVLKNINQSIRESLTVTA